MRKISFALLTLFFAIFCQMANAKVKFASTSHPVYSIIKEIAGDAAYMYRILPPGASPHVYEPKPSDVKEAAYSAVLFYISDNLDAWASKIQVKNKVALLDLVPKECLLNFVKADGGSAGIDPHFWTDPLIVKLIAPKIADIMIKHDPANKKAYTENLAIFIKNLDALNSEIEQIIAPIQGKSLFLHHPSFIYFCNRYNLNYAGAIEESPGKEPSPRTLAALISKVKASGAKAIFNEPQLPAKPVEIIAKAAGVKMETLDPNGGVGGRFTYFEIIKFNAYTMLSALK